MKGFKSKRGISLIVLIITIIVMIILAAAIILSVSNSGIMNKANKAKEDSDAANLKEYVNVLEAEWELMDIDERSSSEYTSKEAYVNAKLYDKGYTDAALGADGEVYAGLNEAAREAIVGGIKIGDVVTGYTLDTISTDKVYETSGDENTEGIAQTTIKRTEYENWKYIGIGEKGEILIAPDITQDIIESLEDNREISLSGEGGYLNGPKELNDICAEMYSTSKGTARSMNIDDITRILDYTGDKGYYYSADGEEVWTKTPKKISELGSLESFYAPDETDIEEYYLDMFSISKTSNDILKTLNTEKKEDAYRKNLLLDFVFPEMSYWLASSCVEADFYNGDAYFEVYACGENGTFACWLLSSARSENEKSYIIRPVVSLDLNVEMTKVSDGNWSI